MWGKVGVNVFVLISGYYLIDTSETVDFHKAAKIIGQLLFYSISISCVLLLLGESKIDLTFIKNTFFPITFSSWWFASAYFVLYLAHPYINILLKRLTPVAFQKIIAIMLMLWCVIPTFFGSQYQSNYFLWFVTLYVLASYIKLYGLNPRFDCRHYCIFFIVVAVLTYLVSVLFAILGETRSVFSDHVTYLFDQNKIPILLMSISLFMFTVQKKPHFHKMINSIASSMFGVYLIHDNQTIRKFLWIDLFQNAKYQHSLILVPYSILVVILVFIFCTVIDMARHKVFEKHYVKLLKTLYMYSKKMSVHLVTKIKMFVFGKCC